MDSDDLIRDARRGDRSAQERLLESQRERLRALIRSRLTAHLRTRVDVEDVAQEATLRALRSIDGFRGEDGESFLRWLGGIVNHVILEAARKEKRETIVPLDELEVGPGGDTVSPSRANRRDERFDRLQEALRSLSPDHQSVILLARIERLPMKEVARRLGRSPEAATQLLWRALRKLKESFGSTDSLHLPPRVLEEGDGHDRP